MITAWILCFLTAVWLGLSARSAGHLWLPWALGGAVYALVLSTIVLGLRRATIIAISPDAYAVGHTEATIAALFLIAIPGWLALRSAGSKPKPKPPTT